MARPSLPLLAALVAVAAPAPAVELDAELSADAIYARVLENRFDASVQEFELASGDRAGREAPIRVMMMWRHFGEGTPERRDGIQSRTLVRYLEPAEVEDTGYLVIQKEGAPDDQFIYLESMRRVRRISLRSETLVGTDLSVEDIVPREMDDATYARIADEEVEGAPCYVIDAFPTAEADSAYAKMRLYVEAEHFVPIRTRYWDRAGLEVKELVSPRDAIRQVEGVWLPIRARMTQLQDRTYTRLRVARLAPNPELPKKWFTQRQLEAGRLRLPKDVRKALQPLE